MKRRDLVRHIESRGCLLWREGKKHSVFINPNNNRTTTVPRHTEVNNFLADKICRDLNVTSFNSRKK